MGSITPKASDVFKKGENNIGYVDSSFIKEFGDDEVLPGSILKFDTLKHSMTDSEIISEFGIQECTLGDVLKTIQGSTPEMKDGYSNIFYIKGHSRVVGVDWDGGGWRVFDWVRDVSTWGGGTRVFSSAKLIVAGSSNPKSSESLTLSSSYTEMVEWLYLNTGTEMSSRTRKELIDKLKEVLK